MGIDALFDGYASHRLRVVCLTVCAAEAVTTVRCGRVKTPYHLCVFSRFVATA